MSSQFPILDLTEAYHFGYKLRNQLEKEMPCGKPIMSNEDAGLLAQIIYNTRGNDHLEIGSAHGGSAIVALKAMKYCGRKDKVVCIDPHGTRSPMKPLLQAFWKNMDHFGYRDRVELFSVCSHPFPGPLESKRFTTAFIDGNHNYEYVLNDWYNLKDRVDCYIMFHDYNKKGVREVVHNHAQADKRWYMSAIQGWSAVLINTKILEMDWIIDHG